MLCAVLCWVVNIHYGGTVVSAGRTLSCGVQIFILCCTLKQHKQYCSSILPVTNGIVTVALFCLPYPSYLLSVIRIVKRNLSSHLIATKPAFLSDR